MHLMSPLIDLSKDSRCEEREVNRYFESTKITRLTSRQLISERAFDSGLPSSIASDVSGGFASDRLFTGRLDLCDNHDKEEIQNLF